MSGETRMSRPSAQTALIRSAPNPARASSRTVGAEGSAERTAIGVLPARRGRMVGREAYRGALTDDGPGPL